MEPLDEASITIEVMSGPEDGRRWTFFRFPVSIGRLEENDVALRLDGRVSRRHARLRLVEGELYLEDLKSRNGTYIGDRRIEMSRIEPGELFRVGSTWLRIVPKP